METVEDTRSRGMSQRTASLAPLALSIGGFGIGLTEFVIAGLLTEVADDLGVDRARFATYAEATRLRLACLYAFRPRHRRLAHAWATAPRPRANWTSESIPCAPSGNSSASARPASALAASRSPRSPMIVALARSAAIAQRDWPVERVNGVPPKTVAPPPAIEAGCTSEPRPRLNRRQRRALAARLRRRAA